MPAHRVIRFHWARAEMPTVEISHGAGVLWGVNSEGRNSMAKKETAKKKATKKKTTASRQTSTKASKRSTTKKKVVRKPKARKEVVKKKAVDKKQPKKQPKKTTKKKPASRSTPDAVPARKFVKKRKGVRRATTTAGLRFGKPARKLGRSQIPIDAPLDIVFQNDSSAREAFVFLEIDTIRELEQFEPDELIRRLTSPAKQTVGRIRKILAMNNRSLENDEAFALEFKERLSQTQSMK